MPPADAADEIFDMFCLCVEEDLPNEISWDLQIHPAAASRIGAEIARKRHADVERIARMSTEEIVSMIGEWT